MLSKNSINFCGLRQRVITSYQGNVCDFFNSGCALFRLDQIRYGGKVWLQTREKEKDQTVDPAYPYY
jgi:hypothetical protein